jgi:hypothetical protein
MHVDATLKQFLFLDDGPAAHAKRLADWIIEKMGGEGQPWTDSGRRGMRQPSHHAAWNSSRRDPSGREVYAVYAIHNVLRSSHSMNLNKNDRVITLVCDVFYWILRH